MKKPITRKPKGRSDQQWGILNPYGDLWTYETFATPEAAREHVADFWSEMKTIETDISRFRIVRVNVRVNAVWPIVEA